MGLRQRQGQERPPRLFEQGARRELPRGPGAVRPDRAAQAVRLGAARQACGDVLAADGCGQAADARLLLAVRRLRRAEDAVGAGARSAAGRAGAGDHALPLWRDVRRTCAGRGRRLLGVHSAGRPAHRPAGAPVAASWAGSGANGDAGRGGGVPGRAGGDPRVPGDPGGAGVGRLPDGAQSPRHRAVRRGCAAPGDRARRLPHGLVRPALDAPVRQHRESRLRADGAQGRVRRAVAPPPRGVPRLLDLACLRPLHVLPGAAPRSRGGRLSRRPRAAARGGADAGDRGVDVSVHRRDEQLARRMVRGAALHRHGRAVPAPAARAALATAGPARRRHGGDRRARHSVGAPQRGVGGALPALSRAVRQSRVRPGVPLGRRRVHAVRPRVVPRPAGELGDGAAGPGGAGRAGAGGGRGRSAPAPGRRPPGAGAGDRRALPAAAVRLRTGSAGRGEARHRHRARHVGSPRGAPIPESRR